VQGVGCAAWRLAEVEVERDEERPRLEEICAFATGLGIESPKGDPVGGAWFVLYSVDFVVAVAVVAVAAAAETVEMLTGREARCFGKAEHFEYWEMTAHGKMIGLASGQWKEIFWWVNGGVLVRLPPAGFVRVLTLPATFFEMHIVHATSSVYALIGTYGQKTLLDVQRLFGMLNYFCGWLGQLLMY